MIRSMTGLTSAVPWPTVSVCSSWALIARALSCSSGKFCSYKSSRLKQYLKDGVALRIETVINSPRDLRCNRPTLL